MKHKATTIKKKQQVKPHDEKRDPTVLKKAEEEKRGVMTCFSGPQAKYRQ